MLHSTVSQESLLHQNTNRDYVVEKCSAMLKIKELMENGAGPTTFITVDHEMPQSWSKHGLLIDSINRVNIAELSKSVNVAMTEKFFLCRTIMPAMKLSSITTVVDDPEGKLAVILVLNNCTAACSLKELELVFPVGTILAVKTPFFKLTIDGGYAVRCDNPSDLLFIDEITFANTFPNLKWSGEIPKEYLKQTEPSPRTALEFKNLGNTYFTQQKFEAALKAYTQGLVLEESNIDILANRSAAYLNLEMYTHALKDVDAVLSIEPEHFKAIHRKTRTLCGLRKYKEALEFLTSKISHLDAKGTTEKLLNELQTQMQQQLSGNYDMLYFTKRSDLFFHDTTVEYVEAIKLVNTAEDRRAVIATKDIQAGELILVSKALAIVFPNNETFGFQNITIDLNINSESQRINTPNHRNLVTTVANRLKLEPELGKEVYQLSAGPLGYLDANKGDDCSIVDMKRIDEICAMHGFGGSKYVIQASHLLKDPGSATSAVVFSGLWILPSLIQHSCSDGNACWATFGNFLFVRAFKNIRNGDEIKMSYICAYADLKNRKRDLENFGVVCTCRYCCLEKNLPEKVHVERDQIVKKIENIPMFALQPTNDLNELQKGISALENLLPHYKNLNFHLCVPLTKLGIRYNVNKQYNKSAEVYEKLHDILNSIPVMPYTIVIAANIVENYLKASFPRKARKWGKILRQHFITAYGSTSPKEVIVPPGFLRAMQDIGILID